MLILVISQAVGVNEWNVPFSSKGLGHLCPLSYISVQKNNRFTSNRTTVLIRTQAALQHRRGGGSVEDAKKNPHKSQLTFYSLGKED